jgi:hypothetical protein
MRIPRTIALIVFSLPWIVAVAVFGWVLLRRFPPSGVFVASTTFAPPSAFINPFLPSERVSVPGVQPDGWTGQRITGDPTYMTARVPGPYETVDIEMEFRPIHQPLLEIGLVKDAEGKELDMEPLFFEGLSASGWREVAGGYVALGTDVSLLRSDNVSGLATWDASSTMPMLQDPAASPIETRVSLRGGHDVYAVPAGGSIDMTFSLQDVNRSRTNGTIVFRVFRGDEEVLREAVGTGGSRDTKMGTVFAHRVYLKSASPGVYRIAFQSDDDVFIRGIKTTSRRWVVGPRLNFGDVVGYATTTLPGHAWTTSRHLVAETFHREGLQTVTLGGSQVEVTRTHEAFRLDRADDVSAPVELVAPFGDVRLIGDGWFAFRPDAFFEPKPKRLTDATDLATEHLRGVITSYKRAEALEDGWYRARKTFTVDPSLDRLRIVLSAPGVASRVGAVDVRRMTLIYRREPLTLRGWFALLEQELRNAWHRLSYDAF